VLQFRGSAITSDAGLLPYRELHALSLTNTGADALTGRNGRHLLVGLLRQSVFGHLVGYEDMSDANRLYHDPAMRWVVDGSAPMGQFKRAILASNPPEIWRMSVLRGRIIVCAFCEVAHIRNAETCLTLKIPPVTAEPMS
jgi:hypothetical protein